MYLGIDVGTSSVKAVLIDHEQNVLGSAGAPLSLSRPYPGWSEQAPDDWLAATGQALDALAASCPAEMAAVEGIGLSGQMHGATLLDRADRPLRPAILWNDVRSAEEAAELDADPRFRAITGNIVFPGFTAPKLVWMARHEPESFDRVARVLLPKDYVRLWLTGGHASDMSDSAGTSWLDVGARAWSGELLAATDLDESHMPRLAEGTEPTGRLRDELARRWGMTGRAVVAGGAGDNAAAACGVGVVEPGSAFVSLGTSGVLFAANAGFSPNPEEAVHAFCHALPDAWHQMGVILSATASLEWLSGTLNVSAPDLVAELSERPAGPASVLFLPYLSGERTPHNDARVRGAFTGLSHESDRRSLTQAVLEGVAFAIGDCAAALGQAGTSISRACAVGGGSRSRFWLATIANVLGVPIDVPAAGDFGAAFGAARLGLIAATGADPRAVCSAPPTALTIDPDPTLQPAYADALERWRALYPALKEVMP